MVAKLEQEKLMNQESWDKTFIEVARVFATRSEDKSTQVGAVIADSDNNIRAVGYNGLPRGVKDIPERHERPDKYAYFTHAELNVIASSARNGIATKGCKIYVTLFPCSDCARAIIQAGITEVIVEKNKAPKRWMSSIDISKKMFKEAGVKVRLIK